MFHFTTAVLQHAFVRSSEQIDASVARLHFLFDHFEQLQPPEVHLAAGSLAGRQQRRASAWLICMQKRGIESNVGKAEITGRSN